IIYTPSAGAGAASAHWTRSLSSDTSQLTPSQWDRRTIGGLPGGISMTDYAESTRFALGAAVVPFVGGGVLRASITSVADADQISDPLFTSGVVSNNGTR